MRQGGGHSDKADRYDPCCEKDAFPARVLKRKYPKSGEDLARRYKTYNDQVRLAKKYQKQGKVLILAPDDCCGMETLTKDKSALDKMYHKGYRDAKKYRIL